MNAQRLSHIQGMRGIAILLILFFHLLPQICPSGYIGVDVFFIISGYFLVGKQLETQESFRPLLFLRKKSLRLLTPYLALIFLVTAASIALFPAHDMLESARLMKASLSGLPNVFLDELSGDYFSSDTRTYPLMHLWYMGVLLQCYLLFPLLFWIWSITRCGKKARIALSALIGTASFATAFLYLLHIPFDYANNTYYWTSARIWEFVLGGLLYLLPKPQGCRCSRWLSGTALLCLCVCAFIPFPSSAAGVLTGAILGSLLLRYGADSSARNPLNLRVLLWVGGISFSLYLVHWPCICYAEYLFCGPLTWLSAMGLCCLIVPLSCLFHRAVEKPRYPIWCIALLWLASLGLYKSMIQTRGYHDILHREINLIQEHSLLHTVLPEISQTAPIYTGTEGIRPNQNSPQAAVRALLADCGAPNESHTFVIMGDSHADDFARAMHTVGLQNAWRGVHLDAYVVPFWNADFRTSPHIAPGQYLDEDKAQRIMHWLSLHPELKTVFIVQAWSGRMTAHQTWSGEDVTGDMMKARAAELREWCLKLRELDKQIVLVTDNPRIGTESPRHIMAAYLLRQKKGNFPTLLTVTKAEYEQKEGAFNQYLDALAAEGLCQVLHREDAFFPEEEFRSFDGQILYHRDSHHLTIDGGLLSLSGCMDSIRNLLR